VTLSYYKDIFERLRVSLETHEPEARKVLVTSGDQDGAEYDNWLSVPGDVPFSFPAATNIGFLAAGRDDVLLVNDDCEFTEPIVGVLQRLYKSNPGIGLLSPQVDGDVGNRLQSARIPIDTPLAYSKSRICFVCMYFPRATIDKVGMLDEQFSGYGCDDTDYCMRVMRAGLRLAVTPLVRVKHGGFGELNCSSTFLRNMTADQWKVSSIQMNDLLLRKWGGSAA
jgi:GT2 family glycosyltransferase